MTEMIRTLRISCLVSHTESMKSRIVQSALDSQEYSSISPLVKEWSEYTLLCVCAQIELFIPVFFRMQRFYIIQFHLLFWTSFERKKKWLKFSTWKCFYFLAEAEPKYQSCYQSSLSFLGENAKFASGTIPFFALLLLLSRVNKNKISNTSNEIHHHLKAVKPE